MFEPAEFLAISLPRYCSSIIAQVPCQLELLGCLVTLKNFFKMAISLYEGAADPSRYIFLI